MKINRQIIANMKPCKDRFDNFRNNNEDKDYELNEFLALDNITYSDKVWVVTKLMTKTQLVNWSIMCAESVKVHFNIKYPEDKCLDNLFNYLKSINNFDNLSVTQIDIIRESRDAAYAAAAAAYASAAAAAAAAAYAAYAAYASAAYAYAAYTAAAAYASAAAGAAAYASAADAADAAADAAAAREEQRNLNLLYLSTVIIEETV